MSHARALEATAYAVIDVTGTVPLRPEYDLAPRHKAYRLARLRNSSAIPLHPGAKWKAVKVQIKAFK